MYWLPDCDHFHGFLWTYQSYCVDWSCSWCSKYPDIWCYLSRESSGGFLCNCKEHLDAMPALLLVYRAAMHVGGLASS